METDVVPWERDERDRCHGAGLLRPLGSLRLFNFRLPSGAKPKRGDAGKTPNRVMFTIDP